MIDLKKFYKSNERFRGYVNRYVANYHDDKCTVEKALEHALVREVAKYYQESDAEETGKIPECKSTYAPIGECT